jgi:TPR repeat protein
MPFKFLLWVFHNRYLTQFKKVHEWVMKGFSQHADRGLGDAQELYGFLLLHKGKDGSSKSAGARYLMSCVDENRPKVCWQLHRVFESGDVLGFPKSLERSEKYLKMAERAGHPLAQPEEA